jgi:hypothetical protein
MDSDKKIREVGKALTAALLPFVEDNLQVSELFDALCMFILINLNSIERDLNFHKGHLLEHFIKTLSMNYPPIFKE